MSYFRIKQPTGEVLPGKFRASDGDRAIRDASTIYDVKPGAVAVLVK